MAKNLLTMLITNLADPIEMLLAGILVAVVLIGTYAFGNYFSRRRVEKDFKQPEDILAAVEVYLRYGRNSAAIKLLQRGVERHPEHPALKAKLAEMRGG